MKAYFHKLHTEAHRRYRRGVSFADALERSGVEVTLDLDSSCNVAICGSFHLASEFDAVVHRHDEFLHENKKRRIKRLYLCWDLYPIHVEGTRSGMTTDEKALWNRYVLDIAKATKVAMPSVSSSRRLEQYTGRSASLFRSACDPWYKQPPPSSGRRHVLDVMRKYDDWGAGKVKQACDELGIPCVEPSGGLSFDDFKQSVVDAALLVSAYDEASTGGLTLLEGYALGKPVLASSSPLNGASEHFKERATYFRRGDFGSLKDQIGRMWESSPPEANDGAAWVAHNHSDDAMAADLANIIMEM